jgi:hypothetical protein
VASRGDEFQRCGTGLVLDESGAVVAPGQPYSGIGGTEYDAVTRIQRLERVLPALVVAAAVGILGFRFFAFIADYSVNVLFQDQWDFLGPLFDGHAGLWQLFSFQHGPHREGLGLIADKYLYRWTDWNVRAESFMIGASVFTAMLLALLLKYRLSGRLSYGDAAIPLIFLTMAQFETFIGTPNAAYSGFPLLLIVLYCLALLSPQYRTRYALCLSLNFLLIFTGFGIFMGAVTVGVFALEFYWRIRGASEVPLGVSLAATLVAVASLGSFFLGYRFQTAVDCFIFPAHNLGAYATFVALMAARFFGLMAPVGLAKTAGALIILFAAAIVFALALQLISTTGPSSRAGGRRFRDVHLVSAVLLAYSILFSVNTAVGRVCLGLPAAAWPARYATLLIPGVLAFYFSLQWFRSSVVRGTLTGAFVLLLIPGCLTVDPGVGSFPRGKRAWTGCYLVTENISACNKIFEIYPRPEQTRLKEKLDYLKEHQLNLYADY